MKLLSLVARSLMRKEITEQLRVAKLKAEIATILIKRNRWKYMKKMSIEKQERLKRLTDEAGIISALAIDQRGALKKMINQ